MMQQRSPKQRERVTHTVISTLWREMPIQEKVVVRSRIARHPEGGRSRYR